MQQENLEMYMGAIYRLRETSGSMVPLPDIQKYFGFSLISVNEMVRKLQKFGYVTYERYHGVQLTTKGEEVASALVRRHRIWERFLTDFLKIPVDDVHTVACSLEHAAPELVTERLSNILGQPDACPHGSLIPPSREV